jgi:hypothetical protein
MKNNELTLANRLLIGLLTQSIVNYDVMLAVMHHEITIAMTLVMDIAA